MANLFSNNYEIELNKLFQTHLLDSEWSKKRRIAVVSNHLQSLDIALLLLKNNFSVMVHSAVIYPTSVIEKFESSGGEYIDAVLSSKSLEKVYAKSAFVFYDDAECFTEFKNKNYPRAFSIGDFNNLEQALKNFLSQIKICAKISEKLSKCETVVFGGSFNPITVAHFEIIGYLANMLLKKVEILPNGSSYKLKTLSNNSSRIDSLKEIADLFPSVSLNLIELHKDFNGTYETLRELRHPYFVIGADSLKDIPTWIEPELLINENNFIVFNRHNLNCRRIINNTTLLSKYSDHFIIIDDFDLDVSSSKYKETKDKNLLPINYSK